MVFKDIRHLIFSPLILIVDGERETYAEVADPAVDAYDAYEVIGIRAKAGAEEAIVISLKRPFAVCADSMSQGMAGASRFVGLPRVAARR